MRPPDRLLLLSAGLIVLMIGSFALIGLSNQRSGPSSPASMVATATAFSNYVATADANSAYFSTQVAAMAETATPLLPPTTPTTQPPALTPTASHRLTLTTTQGVITADLYQNVAPQAVGWLVERAVVWQGQGFTLAAGMVQLRPPNPPLVTGAVGSATFQRGTLLLPRASSGFVEATSLTMLTRPPAEQLANRYLAVGQVTSGLAVLDSLTASDRVVGLRLDVVFSSLP